MCRWVGGWVFVCVCVCAFVWVFVCVATMCAFSNVVAESATTLNTCVRALS